MLADLVDALAAHADAAIIKAPHAVGTVPSMMAAKNGSDIGSAPASADSGGRAWEGSALRDVLQRAPSELEDPKASQRTLG